MSLGVPENPTNLHSAATSWVFRTRLIMPMRNSKVNALGQGQSSVGGFAGWGSWEFFQSFAHGFVCFLWGCVPSSKKTWLAGKS